MNERAWKYGDVIRVDPATQPQVPQPDDRRWMVVACTPYRENRWTLLFIDPGCHTVDTSHFPTMYGFCLAEEPE